MQQNSKSVVGAPQAALQTIVKVFIAGFFVLFTLVSVLGMSATVPVSVVEGDTISAALVATGNLEIYQDGELVQSGVSTITYDQPTDNTWDGQHEYLFVSSTEGNQTKFVTVQDVPLTMMVTQPGTEATTNPVTFGVSTNWVADCSVTVDSTTYALTNGQTSLSLTEGVHSLMYSCTSSSESTFESSSVLVDTLPPVITSSSPSGTKTGPFITLTVDTDEIAQCRYGTTDGSFVQLANSMGSQYVLRNTVTVTLTQQGSYTYFVKCQDIHGHTSTTSTIISFLNQLEPTATIELEEEQPLRADTYELTLITSVPMAEMPLLSYRLEPSGTAKIIGLTGNEEEWQGFLTIPEDSKDSIVTFLFSGESVQGVTGTEITSGGVLQIDADAPDPVNLLEVKETFGYIQLSWTYEDSDEYTFNIYRSVDEGVTEADFYQEVGSTRYTDTSAEGARYYYYRIAAVDAAGNVGPLSQEVWGSVINEQLETEPSALSRAQADDEITLLTTAILDANRSIQFMESQTNPTVQKIIDDMNFLEKARSARFELEEHMRILRIATGDVTGMIAASSATRNDVGTHFLTRITPQSETDVTQPSDAEALKRNLAYPLTGAQVDKEVYNLQVQQLQDRLSVRLRAYSFTVWDTIAREQAYTFVEKTVTLDNPENNVMIIEIIPKEVAEDVSEITFNKEPTVLEADPVVQYTFPVLERETFSYVIPKMLGLDVVKKSRTFVYPEPSAVDVGLITGKVVQEKSSSFSPDMLFMLFGIIIVVGLSAYYFTLSQPAEQFKGLPGKQPQRRPRKPRRSIVVKKLVEQPKDSAELIIEAEKLIDGKNYEPALNNYTTVVNALHEEPILNEVLGDQVERVYFKLKLHKHLDDAHRAIDTGNSAAVKVALEQAREAADIVGKNDTVLVMDAQVAFASCARRLNQLEIERLAY